MARRDVGAAAAKAGDGGAANPDGALDAAGERIRALAEEAGGRWGIAIEEIGTSDSGDADHVAWRFGLNEDALFYAASVIKVPIMAAAYAAASEGRLRLGDRVRLRPEDQVVGSGVLHALTPGLRLTVADVVTLMIIVSDNSATNMVIDLVGLDTIRSVMGAVGMRRSECRNKLSIIPAQIEGRNRVCASDMVALYRAIAKGRVVSWDACRRMVETLKHQQFTEGIAGLLEEGDDVPVGRAPRHVWATKSGWVKGIVHDTGLIYVAGRTFAAAFLSADVWDRPSRESPHRARRAIAQMARTLADAVEGR